MFVDGSYFKMETGDYQATTNTITNLNSPLKDSPLPTVKSVQIDGRIYHTIACQLAKDQRPKTKHAGMLWSST